MLLSNQLKEYKNEKIYIIINCFMFSIGNL